MDGRVIERDLDPDFDEHAWLLQQAAVLRAHRPSALDAEHLAEFLESMAKREVREAVSQIERLYMHRLKFEVQPKRATRSWAISVVNAQNKLLGLLESATLRQAAEAKLPQAWARARRAAAAETETPLSDIPVNNPWTLDDALAWTPPFDLPARIR
jgi:ADP-ribose pyrophosphatase YjhB (NUDIX family)